MRSCPLDYPLLGMHWRGKHFFDAAVPFGIRNGALCMQAITSAVIDILHSKGHEGLAYIDNLAGAHATENGAQQAFDECARIWKELGLVKAEEKQSKPSTAMVWLGVKFRLYSNANEYTTEENQGCSKASGIVAGEKAMHTHTAKKPTQEAVLPRHMQLHTSVIL